MLFDEALFWDNKEPETPPNFEESSTNSRQMCLCSSTTHLNKYARQLANLPQMQGVTKKKRVKTYRF